MRVTEDEARKLGISNPLSPKERAEQRGPTKDRIWLTEAERAKLYERDPRPESAGRGWYREFMARLAERDKSGTK